MIMPTIRIPIRTILSLFPVCVIGGVGVGLIFPGVEVEMGVRVIFCTGRLVEVGLILRGVRVMFCKSCVVEVSLIILIGVMVGLSEARPPEISAALDNATRNTMMTRRGRRSCLIISY